MAQQRVAPRGYNPVTPRLGAYIPAPRSLGMDEALQSVGQHISKLLEENNERQRLEGIVDATAGNIQEKSWLDKRGYEQGVQLVNFTNDQAEINSKLREEATKAAEAGESVEQYKERVKPLVIGLNERMNELGLTGNSRAAAQKGVLESAQNSMTQYQRAIEQQTVKRIDNAKQVGIQGVAQDVENGIESPTSLQTLFTNVYELESSMKIKGDNADPMSKNPRRSASVAVKDALQISMHGLQLHKPEDRAKLNRIKGMAQNMFNTGMLDAGAVIDIQDMLLREDQKATQAVGYDLESRLKQREVELFEGRPMGKSEYNLLQQDIQNNLADGRLTPEQARSHRDLVTTMYKQSLSEQKQRNQIGAMTFAERTAGNVSEEKYADAAAASIHAQQNYDLSDPQQRVQYAGDLIKFGSTDYGSTKLQSKGVAILMEPMNRAFNLRPEELRERGDQAGDQAAWTTAIEAARKNPYVRSELLNSTPPEHKASMEEFIFSRNPVTTLGTDLSRIMEKSAETKRLGTSDYKLPKIDNGNVVRWKGLFGRQGVVIKDAGTNDNVVNGRVDQLNQIANEYKFKWQTEGNTPKTPEDVIGRLHTEGRIVRSSYGDIPISKELEARFGFAGKTAEYKEKYMDAYLKNVAKLHNAAPEDMFISVHRGGIDVYHMPGNKILSESNAPITRGNLVELPDNHTAEFSKQFDKELDARERNAKRRPPNLIKGVGGNTVAVPADINDTRFANQGTAIASTIANIVPDAGGAGMVSAINSSSSVFKAMGIQNGDEVMPEHQDISRAVVTAVYLDSKTGSKKNTAAIIKAYKDPSSANIAELDKTINNTKLRNLVKRGLPKKEQ